jgi:hypothetical protein
VLPLTLESIEAAFRSAFAQDTCADDDLPLWSRANPSRGHCAVAALTLNDLLGGDLVVASVDRDGDRVGVHYWNRIGSIDIDLTRQQFLANETIGTPDVVVRPPGRPKRYADQYETFRSRVGASLGIVISSSGQARTES